MRKHVALLISGVAVAGLLVSAPATARPLEKGHFHDVFSETGDCAGTPIRDDGNVRVNFLFNQRGGAKHPFPYYRESVHGSIVHTNLNTGGTFTEVFANNSQDHKIVDNGDGTITITEFASGGFSAPTTRTASWSSRIPARSGSLLTWTTTALPATPMTTWRSTAPSESSASPPAATTRRVGTSL